jgi:large repetitive protein
MKLMKRISARVSLMVMFLLAACGGGGGDEVVLTPTSVYTIGGTVTGLGAGKSVVLRNNGGNDFTVSAEGSFAFTNAIPSGATYGVSVATQPVGQVCVVSNASGILAGANVTNVLVTCTNIAPNTYTIGGTVSGLIAGRNVVLRNNGGNDLSVSATGPFTFTGSVNDGAAYAVTISTQPAGQTCTVANGTGTVAGANVANIALSCVPIAYAIGGAVTGLIAGGSVALSNNGGNNLTVGANGSFSFTTMMNSGATYNVTVATQPVGQTCTVANGTGTVVGGNVTNITVTCIFLPATAPLVWDSTQTTWDNGTWQ